MDKFDELNDGMSGFPMIIAGVPAEEAIVEFTMDGTPVQKD